MFNKLLCHIFNHVGKFIKIQPHLIDVENLRLYVAKIECSRCGEIHSYIELGNKKPVLIKDIRNLTLSTEVSKEIKIRIIKKYQREGKLK